MSDLLWPGDHRAGTLLTDRAVVAHALRVETAWLAALVHAGVAPGDAAVELASVVDDLDVAALAQAAEGGGNLVIPLVATLRGRLGSRHKSASDWLHRGLTSQDVLDTALVLAVRDAVDATLVLLDEQVGHLAALARRHRSDLMVGRTLTQHAVPITFGLKAAQWLNGVLDVREDLVTARGGLPVQVGGAAGTLAAPVELLALSGSTSDVGALTHDFASRLGLPHAAPWHTNRSPLLRTTDVLVRAHGTWGRIASDVLVLARPEVGELAEPTASRRGGSSTMPHKANPVLSVLIRRAALSAPMLAAQLHVAAASYVDERPDGAWHVEWSTLAQLGRHTVTAASHSAELLAGLHVDTGKMERFLHASTSGLLAEQRSIRKLFPQEDTGELDPRSYLGSSDDLIDQALARAESGRPA